jgi:hypothetical protein
MHEAVFEAAWDAEGLMASHRAVVAPDHRGRGREVLRLAWPSAHHDRGRHIWGVQAAWDHVQQRPARYQPVVTAVLAHRALIDGVAVVVPQPNHQAEERAYWQDTGRASAAPMEEARGRGGELVHHRRHRQSDKKRTERALEIVPQREQEGHVPSANYACDHGVLTVDLTRVRAQSKTHGVRALECSRHL